MKVFHFLNKGLSIAVSIVVLGFTDVFPALYDCIALDSSAVGGNVRP